MNYPKVCLDNKGNYFITFYLNHKRFRLYSGDKIGIDLKPNSFPFSQRKAKAKILAAEIYKYIYNGNKLIDPTFLIKQNNARWFIQNALEIKLKSELSDSYKSTLKFVAKKLIEIVKQDDQLTNDHLQTLLKSYSGTSYNTIRKHLIVIINQAIELKMPKENLQFPESIKQEEKLHKPIKNLPELIQSVKEFNFNLYLCCLFTYCCLLRPHREVRLLKWGDFTSDFRFVSIDGSRVKSKKNRVVPVPKIIAENLNPSNPNYNIFSNSSLPYNKDYFKKLWSRFKKNHSIENNITLYSFRHSAAIELFSRTESITKLQRAMGHSSVNVSLTYLRGLEVPQLSEEDMPTIG